jgi:hypothetical protein
MILLPEEPARDGYKELMHMTRRQNWLSLACCLALLFVSAVPTRGESYVELFIGGVHTENEHIPFSILHPYANGVSAENLAVPGRIHLAINQSGTAGLRLGTWFVKEGFPKVDYPPWMRYFGCYFDFSYHRLDYRPQQQDTVSIDNVPPVFSLKAVPNDKHTNRFLSEARVFTLAFMLAARYGFLPTEQMPFGRLQPYIALGPGIFIMDQEVTIQTMSYIAEKRMFNNWFNISPQSNTSVSICLIGDAGLRWMFTKHVSADLFFRFRPGYAGLHLHLSGPSEQPLHQLHHAPNL